MCGRWPVPLTRDAHTPRAVPAPQATDRLAAARPAGSRSIDAYDGTPAPAAAARCAQAGARTGAHVVALTLYEYDADVARSPVLRGCDAARRRLNQLIREHAQASREQVSRAGWLHAPPSCESCVRLVQPSLCVCLASTEWASHACDASEASRANCRPRHAAPICERQTDPAHRFGSGHARLVMPRPQPLRDAARVLCVRCASRLSLSRAS